MNKITLITLIIFFCLGKAGGTLFAAEARKPVPLLPVNPVTVKAQEPPVPVAPIPESTYNYNPLNKPDPFRAFVEEEIAAKKNVEKKGVGSIFPLQRMETDQFRIVGIAGDETRRVAVVEDAAKKYYPLFVGTHIGINKGKVIEILPDRVVVEEYTTKKAKRIILKLHKNQNEVKP
jgi:type IV pilus assembly protein PilP